MLFAVRSSKSIIAAVLSLTLAGCAGHRGPINPNPTDQEAQQTRADAIRAADAVGTAVVIVNQVGIVTDTLPISVSAKNEYDCTVLRITGTTGPVSEKVAATCHVAGGPGPLYQVLEVLKSVSTKPSLKATLQQAAILIKPLLDRLAADTNPTLHSLGAILSGSVSILTVILGS